MNPQTKQSLEKPFAQSWLALEIGNSHLHWAWFVGSTLKQAWNTPHLDSEAIASLIIHQLDFNHCPEAIPASLAVPPPRLPLQIASVVPSQTLLWQAYPLTYLITLDQIPLHGLYSTFGVDRALSLWGAATVLGLPALVIDAGTALTFTGANASGQLIGGAILPGLGLQMRALAEYTAVLPSVEMQLATALPPRWSLNTADAIRSGVVYTLLAGVREFIEAWSQQFPGGAIALKGGDRALLFKSLQQQYPVVATQITLDPYLMFWGMRAIASSKRNSTNS
jgi:type III pantothenate kinase